MHPQFPGCLCNNIILLANCEQKFGIVNGARLNFRGSGLLERKFHILHLKIDAKNICWRCLCRLRSHKIFASLHREPGEPLKFNCSKMRRIIQKIIMEKMRLSNSNFGTNVTDMLQPPDDSELDRVFLIQMFQISGSSPLSRPEYQPKAKVTLPNQPHRSYHNART